MIMLNEDPEFTGKLCRRRSDPDIHRPAPPVPPPVPRIRERPPEALATAFLASLVIPGAGQLMKNQALLALVFFIGAVIVWWPPLTAWWPIVMVHLTAAFNTLSRK